MNFLNDLTVWKLSKTAPNALKHHINAKEYAIRWPTDLAFVPLVIYILIITGFECMISWLFVVEI